MNQNNSSSANRDEVISIDDFNDRNYEGELQKLKCDNFQLRLMCYNYENTLSELECNPNDENEVSSLKKSYYKNIERVNSLEENIQRILKENSRLKKQLLRCTDIEICEIKQTKEVGVQIVQKCVECEVKEKTSEKVIDEMKIQLKCLEEVNLELQSTLDETSKLLCKPTTFQCGCNTENVVAQINENETNLMTDSESDFTELNQCKPKKLKNICEEILEKLEKFSGSYRDCEMELDNLENQLRSTLRVKYIKDSIFDEKYKTNLFQDKSENDEVKYVYDIIQKCQSKIIDDELSEYMCYNDEIIDETGETYPTIMKNPNILTIVSAIDKLNEASDDRKLLKQKLKSNEDWYKHISREAISNTEFSSVQCLNEEFDIHINKITDITSNFTKLIPLIQSSFIRTISQLDKTKFIKNKDITNHNEYKEYYHTFIKQYHEKNTQTFLDKCNLFFQITTECIFTLNKEKMFLNSSPGLLHSLEHYEIGNSSDVEVEIMDDIQSLNNHISSENPQKAMNLQQKNIESDQNTQNFISLEIKSDYIIQTEIEGLQNQIIQNPENDENHAGGENVNEVHVIERKNTETLEYLEYSNNKIIIKQNDKFQNKFTGSRDSNDDVLTLSTIQRTIETQTNYKDYSDQNTKDFYTNITYFDMEDTSIVTKSNSENHVEIEDVIPYSNQSNQTYNIFESLCVNIKNGRCGNVAEYLTNNNEYIPTYKLRRCFSLSSAMHSDNQKPLNTNFYSYSNVNCNNEIQLGLRNHINHWVKEDPSDERSISITSANTENISYRGKYRERPDIHSISHAFRQRHPYNENFLLSSIVNSTEIEKMLFLVRLRVIKLLFVRDLKKNLQCITKRDAYVNMELAKIMDTFMEIKSQHSSNDSNIFLEIQNHINQWGNQVDIFNQYMQRISQMSIPLLSLSDRELVQMTYVLGESSLDMDLSGTDILSSANAGDIFDYLELMVSDMNKQYSTMDELYFNIIEKKQQIVFQFTKEYQSITHNQMELKFSQLQTENEKFKYQYRSSLIDKERMESQMQFIKVNSKTTLMDLTTEKENLQEELENSVMKNVELTRLVDRKIEEEINRQITTENGFNKNNNEISELKEELHKLLHENANLNRKITELRQRMDMESEESRNTNSILNDNENQEKNLIMDHKEFTKEINEHQLHEKQFSIDNNRFEKLIQKKNIEIELLNGDIAAYIDKLKDSENQLIFSENNYLCKIDTLNSSIKEIKKKKLQLKERLVAMDKDIKNLVHDLNVERSKSIQENKDHKSIQQQLLEKQGKLELEFITKLEFHKDHIKEIHERLVDLIDLTFDLFFHVHHSDLKNIWQMELVKNLNIEQDEPGDLKQLKIISCHIKVFIMIVEKEIKKVKTLNSNEPANLLPSENVAQASLPIYKEDMLGKNLKPCKRSLDIEKNQNLIGNLSKKENDEILVKIDMNCRGNDLSKYKGKSRKPVPTPRQYSKQFNGYQKNKTREKLNNKTIFEESGEEQYEEEIESLLSNSSVSLNMDYSQEYESERSITSLNAVNTSQVSGLVAFKSDGSDLRSETVTKQYLEDKQKIVNLINILLHKLTSDSDMNDNIHFNMKDCDELRNFTKTIDLTMQKYSTNISPNNASLNISYEYENQNINNLIMISRNLTDNLIKTTNQLIDLQHKFELVNSNLSQCQISKHELSVELVAKYEKIKILQSMINNYQSLSRASKCESQATQTHNSSPWKHRKSLEDTDSRNSNNTIIKASEIQEVYKTETNNDVSKSSPKFSCDRDWDDVTRTMIKCLTTLSEVQESLVTPTIDNEKLDNSNPKKTISVHDTKSSQENEKKVAVAVIKERKYKIIRQLTTKVETCLIDILPYKEMENGISKIEKVEKSFEKLNFIISNCFRIRSLSIEQWNLLINCKESQHPNFNEGESDELSRNPLQITDSVHVDFVRLQQRLERYQNRYKSLKHAVMSNKYKLKDAPCTIAEECVE